MTCFCDLRACMHARAGERQEYGYVPWIPLDRPDHDDLQQRLFDRLTVLQCSTQLYTLSCCRLLKTKNEKGAR